MPTTFNTERARVAILTRHRPAGHPELICARQRMAEERLIVAVERALEAAPPLSSEVRDRLINLLGTTPLTGGRTCSAS